MSSTTFYLIRHAQKEGGEGWLPGRTPGVHITGAGRIQAERLAEALSRVPFSAIYCSPIERAQETAQPLSRCLGIPIQKINEFTEIDFGAWTDRSIADLNSEEEWQYFNTFRSGARTPGGEVMVDVQARFVRKMIELKHLHPEETVAVFSHGDPIRFAVCYFLGMPLDHFHRLQIDSGSVSVIQLAEYGSHVRCVNQHLAERSGPDAGEE